MKETNAGKEMEFFFCIFSLHFLFALEAGIRASAWVHLSVYRHHFFSMEINEKLFVGWNGGIIRNLMDVLVCTYDICTWILIKLLVGVLLYFSFRPSCHGG